jgi:hypothetical protein
MVDGGGLYDSLFTIHHSQVLEEGGRVDGEWWMVNGGGLYDSLFTIHHSQVLEEGWRVDGE